MTKTQSNTIKAAKLATSHLGMPNYFVTLNPHLMGSLSASDQHFNPSRFVTIIDSTMKSAVRKYLGKNWGRFERLPSCRFVLEDKSNQAIGNQKTHLHCHGQIWIPSEIKKPANSFINAFREQFSHHALKMRNVLSISGPTLPPITHIDEWDQEKCPDYEFKYWNLDPDHIHLWGRHSAS